MTFKPAALSDDDLRAAVAVARQRLPHVETCEHCADRAAADKRSAEDYRRRVAEFNDRAARAGYLIPSSKTLVHRWDCPTMQAYLRAVEEHTNSEGYLDDMSHGYEMAMPKIATLEQVRAFIGSSKTRRGCRTCAPDL